MQDISCNEFIQSLASKEPTPGGGGASAYVGALGVALGSMVGNLTLGKKKYADVQADIEALQGQASVLIERFKALVDRDAEAFAPLARAYGLPQGTDDEKMARDEALQQALVGATLVPLEIADACVEAIRLHGEYAQKGTRIAISDVGVGVIFCKAALQGAALNVSINTRLMKDIARKAALEARLDQALADGLPLADRIYRDVAEQLR